MKTVKIELEKGDIVRFEDSIADELIKRNMAVEVK